MNAPPPRRGAGKGAGESELRACVRRTLETYFDDLDGTDANGLLALVMSEVEVPLLQVVMDRTGGNQTQAAQVLGINRGTLRKKLGQYGLD